MSTAATLSAIARDLSGAIQEARSAYEFNPNSYTYAALSACLAAERCFTAYHTAVVEIEDG